LIFQILVFVGKVDTGESQNQSTIRNYISAYPILTGLLRIVVGIFTEEYNYRGIYLGIVQERYKNIWYSYFVHVLWNTMGTLSAVILAL